MTPASTARTPATTARTPGYIEERLFIHFWSGTVFITAGRLSTRPGRRFNTEKAVHVAVEIGGLVALIVRSYQQHPGLVSDERNERSIIAMQVPDAEAG